MGRGKKFLVLLLALVFIGQPYMILQAEGEEDEIREEIIEYYENDPEYIRMSENNPELADDYIDKLVQNKMDELQELKTRTTDTYGNVAYKTVPVITQSTTTNCSAATLLQTMYGLNKQNDVYGSTYAAKQATLYNYTSNSSAPGARIESSPGTSLWVYEIVSYLNNHLLSSYYSYRVGTSMNIDEFKTYIWTSLVHDRPVMLHAYTSSLSYYNGNALYHYLSLDSYNRNTGVVTIKDCNYSSYGGSHTNVPVCEAYYAIRNVSGRYLISY